MTRTRRLWVWARRGAVVAAAGYFLQQHYHYRAHWGQDVNRVSEKSHTDVTPFEQAMGLPYKEEPLVLRLSRDFVSTVGMFLIRAFVQWRMKEITVEGLDLFWYYRLEAQRRKVGFVSVSNHTCTIDDPVILSLLAYPPKALSLPDLHTKDDRIPASLPVAGTESSEGGTTSELQCPRWWTILMDHQFIRWSVCKTSICHSTALLSIIFSGLGKVLPIHVGGGVDQSELTIFAQRLRYGGEWLHLFPEGRVWQDSTAPFRDDSGCWCSKSGRKGVPYLRLGPLKWGIGKLVLMASCDDVMSTPTPTAIKPLPPSACPIIVPIFHTGMEPMIPLDANSTITQFLPNLGLTLRVRVGKAIYCDDLVEQYQREVQKRGGTTKELQRKYYIRITKRVDDALIKLALEMSAAVANKKLTK